MTGLEMIYNFQALLEDISPQFKEKDKLDTYIILDYLNRTQARYIKMKYFGGKSFKENTYKISEMLDEFPDLITDTPVVGSPTFTPVPGMPPATVFSIPRPVDMIGYIRANLEVTRDSVLPMIDTWIPMEEIDFNDIDSVLTTPLNLPILEKPLITYMGDPLGASSVGGFIIIVDTHTTPSNVVVTYLREPRAITSTEGCELADKLHEEIVKLAVSMYIDEYKTKLQPKQAK